MHVKAPLTRAEAGLPDGARVVRVVHNRPAAQTIVEVALAGPSPKHRIFARAVGHTTYRAIGTPRNDESFLDVFTCDLPKILFRIEELQAAGDGFTGRFVGLFAAALGDGTSITPFDLSSILAPDSWISQLLRVNDDGTVVETIVGFGGGGRVIYKIYAIDLQNQAAVELDELPGIRF